MIDELNYGYTSFDNFYISFLTVFYSTSVSGWTDAMYMIRDAQNFAMSAIYFTFLITICSYFIFNLALAVMLDNINKIK